MSTPPSQPPTRWSPWYFRPRYARWLGPLLVAACVALRFGWGGIAGPPAPFWIVAYLVGAAGGLVTYAAFMT